MYFILLCYCSDILNETVPTPDHRNPAGTDHTFLIKNHESHTCLAPLSTRNNPANPINYNSHTALYPVVMVTCDIDSPNQHWQWIANGSLLHSATFLCLGVHYGQQEAVLVLQTCKARDLDQKWNCATNHIKQPDTQSCIGALGVEGGGGGETSRRKKREDYLWGNKIRPNSLETSSENNNRLNALEIALEEVIHELHSLHKEKARENVAIVDSNVHSQVGDNLDTRYNTDFEFCLAINNLQKWTIVYSGGDDGQSSICSSQGAGVHNLPRCYPSDMESASGASYMRLRWALCSHDGYYVSGFYHTSNVEGSGHRDNGLISAVKCCAGDYVFTGQENTPVQQGEEKCEDLEWWQGVEYSETIFTRGWFTCPRGMYLKGFLLSTQAYVRNENLIRIARCCRPVDGPEMFRNCYSDRVTRIMDTEVHECRLRGYHIVGVVRKNCGSMGQNCEETLTCCM